MQTGIILTALGICAFVAGVGGARKNLDKRSITHGAQQAAFFPTSVPQRFLIFCLIGGWALTFSVRTVVNIPSINAVIDKGGAVWLLGVMIGLASAVRRRSAIAITLWTGALLVYPAVILVIGGFMSWGSASIVLAASILCVTLKRYWRVVTGVAIGAVLGTSLFVNYFEIRSELRKAAWGGAPFEERASIASKIFTEFEFLSPDNPEHLDALDQRLNQNYFIGLAAERLERGQVEYLWGRSVWEGGISLIPRIIWPDKPVFGGSGDIVPEMTGLELERTGTAWGVGSVMEFYINFGVAGVIGGFFLLGFLIGRLDWNAARSLGVGQYGQSLIYFLPCVALIQPLGSIVELSGGAAAALLAAFAWRSAWQHWNIRGRRSNRVSLWSSKPVSPDAPIMRAVNANSRGVQHPSKS